MTSDENQQLFSITDEAATTKESGFEDDDDGEDIIKSINNLLDKGTEEPSFLINNRTIRFG